MQKPIQRVKFTKAVARHAYIRDQNPSLGYICPGEPHERSPNAPKFEDRSQEETEWQEQGAREAAWKLAKSLVKIKGARKSNVLLTFGKCACQHQLLNLRNENVLSTPERRCKRSAKKDLSDTEMDTLTKSCSPMFVITANGEMQTHEEAMEVLENTPAVLSFGKLCDENGYSYEWINGQKPHLIKNGIRIPCNTENIVPIVVPGFSANSSARSDSSTSKTLSRKESHCSTSSSSSSSPSVSESQTREREDGINNDTSPVQVSTSIDF